MPRVFGCSDRYLGFETPMMNRADAAHYQQQRRAKEDIG